MSCIFDEGFGMDKEEICNRFSDYGVDMRPLFYPLTDMPAFSPYLEGKEYENETPFTYAVSKYGVCLPNGYNLDEEDVIFLGEVCKDILTKS